MNPRLILASLGIGILALSCGGKSGPTSTTTQSLSADGGRGHGEQDDQDDEGRRDGQAGQGREDDNEHGDGAAREMHDNEHEDGGESDDDKGRG